MKFLAVFFAAMFFSTAAFGDFYILSPDVISDDLLSIHVTGKSGPTLEPSTTAQGCGAYYDGAAYQESAAFTGSMSSRYSNIAYATSANKYSVLYFVGTPPKGGSKISFDVAIDKVYKENASDSGSCSQGQTLYKYLVRIADFESTAAMEAAVDDGTGEDKKGNVLANVVGKYSGSAALACPDPLDDTINCACFTEAGDTCAVAKGAGGMGKGHQGTAQWVAFKNLSNTDGNRNSKVEAHWYAWCANHACTGCDLNPTTPCTGGCADPTDRAGCGFLWGVLSNQ